MFHGITVLQCSACDEDYPMVVNLLTEPTSESWANLWKIFNSRDNLCDRCGGMI